MVMDFKEGDWHCPSCGDHQFARNATCRRCGAARDAGAHYETKAPIPSIPSSRPIQRVTPSRKNEDTSGDWNCPSCGDYQFARNAACRKCGGPKPGVSQAPPPAHTADFKEGDWNCVECGDHQFARNASCRRCGAPRPTSTVVAPRTFRDRTFTEARPILAPVSVAAPVSERGFMPGDWHCAACGDHQFARNASCRRCGAERPEAGEVHTLRGVPPVIEIDGTRYIPAPIQPARSIATVRPSNGQDFKAGDWECPACGDHQFERNSSCRKCGEPKPAEYSSAGPTSRGRGPVEGQVEIPARHGRNGDFKPGDWNCPTCGDHQFQRNEHCRKCGTPRPETTVVTSSNNLEMKPGDWICAACGDMQFARNENCRRCGAPREDAVNDAASRSRSPHR